MACKTYKKGDILATKNHSYKNYKIKEEHVVLTCGFDNAGRRILQYAVKFSVKIGNKWMEVGNKSYYGAMDMSLDDVKQLIDLRIKRMNTYVPPRF